MRTFQMIDPSLPPSGTKSRYVDVMNPGGRTGPKPGGSIPAPADLFAPLAPMSMPANLFVPGAGRHALWV